MLTYEELCQGIADLGYRIKWVNYENRPRLIIWQGSAPVADILLEVEGYYNIDYPTFEEMDTVAQIQLSTLLVQYAYTPLAWRKINL